MTTSIRDPDEMIKVVHVMPSQASGGPLIMRTDEPHSWARILEEIQSHITEGEDGDSVEVSGHSMRLGDYVMLPEHQGW